MLINVALSLLALAGTAILLVRMTLTENQVQAADADWSAELQAQIADFADSKRVAAARMGQTAAEIRKIQEDIIYKFPASDVAGDIRRSWALAANIPGQRRAAVQDALKGTPTRLVERYWAIDTVPSASMVRQITSTFTTITLHKGHNSMTLRPDGFWAGCAPSVAGRTDRRMLALPRR